MFLVFGCSQQQQNGKTEVKTLKTADGKKDENIIIAQPQAQEFEKVAFKTSDGFTISGNLFRSGKKSVIMLHQFTSDKSAYSSLAQKLKGKGYTALAIDLRGHGESLGQNGLRRQYSSFVEGDFRDMIRDVQAAKEFLESNGFSVDVVIGASIGANTALNFAAQNQGIGKVILLSPGFNYKGIETETNAPTLEAKTLIAASRDDEYGFASSSALAREIPNAQLREFINAGHGTKMFLTTNLENEILDWITK